MADTLEARLRQQDAHVRLAGMACDTVGCPGCCHLDEKANRYWRELRTVTAERDALRRELAAVRAGEGR